MLVNINNIHSHFNHIYIYNYIYIEPVEEITAELL